MEWNKSINQSRALDRAELFTAAPSIFADSPHERTSSKYEFIPTTQVIDLLENEGWHPVSARQSRVKADAGQDFAKHLIRFRRHDAINTQLTDFGDSVVELVLSNSHNGLSSYTINLGLFRQVCANGLVAQDKCFGTERIKHLGFKSDDVVAACYRVLDSVPEIADKVARYQSIMLREPERIALAECALSLKYDPAEHVPIQAKQLLSVRRYGDNNADLWTTFNVIQENMMRGGLRGRSARSEKSPHGRRMTTRAVGSVDNDLKLNKALWSLADRMAELKQA